MKPNPPFPAAADNPTITLTEGGTVGSIGPAGPCGASDHAEQRYVVAEERARGGLGRVMAARDLRLDRTVAIKEPLVARGGVVERFRREAAVTAQLQHPAIVPVYDAGNWPDGNPYFVMKLVSGGRTLRDVVDEAATLDRRMALLPNVIAVADAIAYAHHKQVIHRDLKPSNVLVGPFGETVVIDWGLAKDCAVVTPADVGDPYRAPSSIELTSSGSILGTPQYMPPEQARGEAVDKRADVYSLGALLYFVLSGAAPFEGEQPMLIIERVCTGQPTPLEQRQRGIPEDLTAIVRKAMARLPEERYPSAAELADDLKRFQTGQLVRAHQYSTGALMRRWIARHRSAVVTALVLLVALAATSIAGVVRIAQERARAERRANALVLTQARSALGRDPTAAVSWLKRYPADAEDWAQARMIATEAPSLGVARHVFPRDFMTLSEGGFSRDGRRYASMGLDSTIRVWDVDSGRTLASLQHAQPARLILLTPDAGQVVFVDETAADLRVWKPGAPRERVLRGHSQTILDLVLSPDGRSAVTGSDDQTVRVWDLDSGVARVFRGHRGKTHTVRFSSDGASVISASSDGSVRVWTIATGAVRVLAQLSEPIQDMAVSANDVVVAATIPGVLRWWDLRHGTSGQLPKVDGNIVRIALAPDGSEVAAACEDHSVHVVTIANGRSRVQRRFIAGSATLAFAPKRNLLAAAAQDGEILLWDLDTGQTRALRGHPPSIMLLLFAPDGRTLASSSQDKTTRLWPIAPEPGVVRLGHTDQIQSVAFAPDGSSLVTASRDTTVRLWSERDSVRLIGTRDDWAVRASYSFDGKTIASLSMNGGVELFDLQAHSTRRLGDGANKVWAFAFSPASATLATGSVDGSVQLWDLASGTAHPLPGHHSEVEDVAFSHDGRLLASAADDGTIQLTDLASGQSRLLQGHASRVWKLCFSPNDQQLASASRDRTLRLWNVRDGSSTVMPGPGYPLMRVDFSPDGTHVAATGVGPLVRMWSLVDGTARDLRGHHDAVYTLAFSPDSRLLVTGSFDKMAIVWSVADGAPLSVVRHSSDVRDVAIAPAGDRVATATDDGTLVVWPLSASPVVPMQPSDILKQLGAMTSSQISTDETPLTL